MRVVSLGPGEAEDDEGFEIFGRPESLILKQGADGIPVVEIGRRAGGSRAAHFNWKKQYDGPPPARMLRLKQLEDEVPAGR